MTANLSDIVLFYIIATIMRSRHSLGPHNNLYSMMVIIIMQRKNDSALGSTWNSFPIKFSVAAAIVKTYPTCPDNAGV